MSGATDDEEGGGSAVEDESAVVDVDYLLFVRSSLPVATAGTIYRQIGRQAGKTRRGGRARARTPIRLFYVHPSEAGFAVPSCS